MRLNRFIALATGKGRRAADDLIAEQRVLVNGAVGQLGQAVAASDHITLDGSRLAVPEAQTTIMLNKPVGYVCSRDGQGSKTIYDLLPRELRHLKPVGRLDKDSSGLLLLTDDGRLAYELTHPSFNKEKVYEVELDKPLSPQAKVQLEQGVKLEDGLSRLKLVGHGKIWAVTMTEGRNRQIRRTFEALGYNVTKLNRIKFGPHKLGDLTAGLYKKL